MSLSRKSNLLFQLVLRHAYYQDGLSKGLTVAPTRSGAAQLSRFGGLFVADEGGGFVMYPTAQGDTSMPQFPANVTLSMVINDAQFPIFTEISDLAPGMAWYANNLNTGSVSTISLTQMTVRPNQFTIDFTGSGWPTTAGAQRTVSIARLNGQVVMSQTYFTTPTDPTCTLNLYMYSDGAYVLTFTVQGIQQPFTQTFYKADGGMVMPAYAYFEWYAQQAPVTVRRATTTPATPVGQQVSIQFLARETIWQYYLVSKTGTKVKHPKIEPVHVGKRVVKFSQTATMVPLPNGSYATQLTANGVLPLEEVPNHEVMLEAQGLAKPMQLPYAAPNLLYDSAQGGQPSSKIYVYF